MVSKNANSSSDDHVKLLDLRVSFFSLLEKSSVDKVFWPILFESFLSLFKIDSSTQVASNKSTICSSDKSTFDLSDGTFKVSRKRFLRGVVRSTHFIMHLTLATFTPKMKSISGNPILLFGFESRLIETEMAKQSLIRNLKAIHPDLPKDSSEFLIESRPRILQASHLSRSNIFPYVAIGVLRSRYTFRNRLAILLSVAKSAFKMLRNNPNLFYLAPERAFLEFPIWRLLAAELDFRLLTTQSKIELLPVAFYAQSRNRSMVWYSNNSLPFNKIGHELIAPSIASNSDCIDHHFVWSKSHKEFLEYRYPDSRITVVGPILFEPLELLAPNQADPKGVLYFDITPFDNLEVETFYTAKMCTEALADIAKVVQELGLTLQLKPKRPYIRDKGLKLQHSASYLGQLDRLESEKMLTRLDSRVSITESILNCQVVIGLPFTSPVLAASRLNRPSVYYAPLEAGDWDIPSERDGILVLRGKKQLSDFLNGVIHNHQVI